MENNKKLLLLGDQAIALGAFMQVSPEYMLIRVRLLQKLQNIYRNILWQKNGNYTAAGVLTKRPLWKQLLE